MSEPLQLRDVLVDEYLHIHLRLSASNLLRPQQLTKELKAATQHNKRLFALRESLSKQTTVELDSFSADTDPPCSFVIGASRFELASLWRAVLR